MAAIGCNVKYITLRDIENMITCVANFSESTFDSKSVALIISSSGEVTFTSSGCKLLSEINFNHPLTKVIVNVAINYTSLCGDDCKHFMFVIREVFNVLYNQNIGSNDIYTRNKLMHEICSIKKILPCIFESIYDVLSISATDACLDSFSKDLYSIVLTFMLSKFSVNVSKILSGLLCDFICDIRNESNTLEKILEYVISHFDMFVCKIISPITESKLIKGLLLYRAVISSLDLQNAKFIVVWDLTMKIETENVSWKIMNESFASQLNSSFVHQKIFEYLKASGISLILSSSVSDNNVKTLCNKYNILLIDRLEKNEIEYILLCFQLHPLENLNESLELNNIGILSSAKFLSYNNSHFLHLSSVNSLNFLSAHHILLSAPCKAMWKEYYTECLNCCKMILSWLKSNKDMYYHEGIFKEVSNSNKSDLNLINAKSSDCNLCSQLKISSKKLSTFEVKSQKDGGFLVTPGAWEYLFLNVIKIIPDKFKLSWCNILPALHLAVKKYLYKRIGISLSNVAEFENICAEFFTKSKLGEIEFLEPVICKEIMICNVLDLILRLLKIDSVVFLK